MTTFLPIFAPYTGAASAGNYAPAGSYPSQVIGWKNPTVSVPAPAPQPPLQENPFLLPMPTVFQSPYVQGNAPAHCCCGGGNGSSAPSAPVINIAIGTSQSPTMPSGIPVPPDSVLTRADEAFQILANAKGYSIFQGV